MVDASKSAIVPADNREEKKRVAEAQKTYGRGKAVQTRTIKSQKLKRNLKTIEDKYKDATLKAKDAEILLEHDAGFLEPEGELEKTYRVRQDEVRDSVGVETAKKGFELKLNDLGPYRADYTRNGRDLLLAGRKGHVATMDWRSGKLGCELQLGETVRDARWLHNNQYFAVAQKRNVYIYDHHGVELHCLNKHLEPLFLEFLPYHFLLASAVSFLLSKGSERISNMHTANEWFLEVHGHIDRPARGRTAHQTRQPYSAGAEPTQRNPPRRPPEWHGNTLVPEFTDSTGESTGASWPSPLPRNGPTRPVHGIYGPRPEDERVGPAHVPRSTLLLMLPARILRGRE